MAKLVFLVFMMLSFSASAVDVFKSGKTYTKSVISSQAVGPAIRIKNKERTLIRLLCSYSKDKYIAYSFFKLKLKNAESGTYELEKVDRGDIHIGNNYLADIENRIKTYEERRRYYNSFREEIKRHSGYPVCPDCGITPLVAKPATLIGGTIALPFVAIKSLFGGYKLDRSTKKFATRFADRIERQINNVTIYVDEKSFQNSLRFF